MPRFKIRGNIKKRFRGYKGARIRNRDGTFAAVGGRSGVNRSIARHLTQGFSKDIALPLAGASAGALASTELVRRVSRKEKDKGNMTTGKAARNLAITVAGIGGGAIAAKYGGRKAGRFLARKVPGQLKKVGSRKRKVKATFKTPMGRFLFKSGRDVGHY